MTTAKPTKLRDGTWGATVTAPVRAGDTITITTAAGKSWTASVSRVIWTGPARDGGETISIVATGPAPRSGGYGSYGTIGARMEARQRATGWSGCACGSIEGQPRASDCRSCRFDNE